MTSEDLKVIISEHHKWVSGEGGTRADLRGANLRGSNLCEADLRGANLRGSNLCEANLCGADLRGSNLCGADLRGADLRGANLCVADLCGADLRGADLRGANLCGADLRGADLRGADLREANLCGANLCDTCLDPNNNPSGADDSFTRDGEYAIGYRTEKAGHIDRYRVGRCYSADWFSTADTECHPGLYLWPTLDMARNYSGDVPIVKVRTRPECVHKAGVKYRCQWFEVVSLIGEAGGYERGFEDGYEAALDEKEESDD